MNEQINLNHKVAIVTGAARGIGRRVSEALLSAGASVFGVDILKSIHEIKQQPAAIILSVMRPESLHELHH